jgi:hypothetical protein
MGYYGWDMPILSWGYYYGILWDYSANLLQIFWMGYANDSMI